MRTMEKSLVDEYGQFHYGNYDAYFRALNPLDFRGGMWGVLPKSLRRRRLKEWQAYMIDGKKYYILIGAMDMKLFSVLKVLIYDKASNHTWGTSEILHNKTIKVAENLKSGSAFACEKGTTIFSNNFLKNNRIEIGFNFTDALTGDSIRGYFEAGSKINHPSVSVLPLKNSAGFYTHKQLMSIEGYFAVNSKIHSLSSGETTLVLDDQKVFYPYKTYWDWGCAAGIVGSEYCGFTVSDVRAVHEKRNENAFWKDGELHRVEDVKFIHNKKSGNWSILDVSGAVDMEFKPAAKHLIERNMFWVRTKYEGPLGWYSGHIGSESGEKLYVNGMFGMLERMNLRL